MAAIPKCPNQSPGPILESKGMCAIFQKKAKKGQNIWTFGQKCKKNWKYFEKGQHRARNYRSARICPGDGT